MMVRWIVAALHLIALGIGLGAVVSRGRALGGRLDPEGLKRVFIADNLWGLAAVLWISTGLARAFGGLEKGADYYLENPAFHAKMGLLALVLLLEIWPMATLIRWRLRRRRGAAIDGRRGGAFAIISYIQAALVALMVLAATAMARGIGL